MEIGSWGGGHHVQGLHVGAVVLALVCLHHLVRVTAKQVTISNEAGERQEEQYVDIFILKKLRVLWTKLRDYGSSYLGLALLLKCWCLTATLPCPRVWQPLCTLSYCHSSGPELGSWQPC